MNWIDKISNNDNKITMITFENNDVLVHIELWDERKKYIRFINCLGLKEKQCIGDVIGDISVEEDSLLFREIQGDNLNGDGSGEEVEMIKSFVFKDEWNERIILEIVAQSVKYDD